MDVHRCKDAPNYVGWHEIVMPGHEMSRAWRNLWGSLWTFGWTLAFKSEISTTKKLFQLWEQYLRKSEIGILEVAINIMQAPPGYLINFALLNFGGGYELKGRFTSWWMQLTSYDSLQKILPTIGGTLQNIMSTASLLLKMRPLVFLCLLTSLVRSAFAGKLRCCYTEVYHNRIANGRSNVCRSNSVRCMYATVRWQ